MRGFRPHPYDLIIVTLLVVLIARQWPQDPEKVAWRTANLHLARAEYEQAVEQFDRVLELRPEADRALFYRGIALFYLGRYRESAMSMDAGLQMNGDPFMLFWRYMARAHGEGGTAGQAELRQGLRERGLKTSTWPGVLAGALLGEATEEKTLELALSGAPGDKAGHAAEAFFYLGQRRLLEGKTPEATALFARAVNTRARNYLEYLGAAEELRRRGAPPSTR